MGTFLWMLSLYLLLLVPILYYVKITQESNSLQIQFDTILIEYVELQDIVPCNEFSKSFGKKRNEWDGSEKIVMELRHLIDCRWKSKEIQDGLKRVLNQRK